MFNNDEIIQQELELLRRDIILAYEASGKKVSGEFEQELEVRDNALYGVGYLAGRKAGKRPIISRILNWVQARGLQPFISGQTQTQLAFAIANSIAARGTKPENHYKIYEDVITPERIQQIIDKVSSININAFIDTVVADLNLLIKDL